MINPEFPIAPALVRRAEQLLKLQHLCYQDEAALYGDWTLPPLVETLTEMLAAYDTHRILVARLGAEVVGAVRCHLNTSASRDDG